MSKRRHDEFAVAEKLRLDVMLQVLGACMIVVACVVIGSASDTFGDWLTKTAIASSSLACGVLSLIYGGALRLFVCVAKADLEGMSAAQGTDVEVDRRAARAAHAVTVRRTAWIWRSGGRLLGLLVAAVAIGLWALRYDEELILCIVLVGGVTTFSIFVIGELWRLADVAMLTQG